MENPRILTSEFEEVLKDVRSSYRLLYQYQKRVMDLVTFIGNYWGFQFDSGESIFSGPPATWKRIDPGRHWAWDFLLLYNYNFVFSAKTYGRWTNLRLMINITSDTGYYDNSNPTKTRVQDFAPVEDSRTQLHIILKTQGIAWNSYMDKQYTALSESDSFFEITEEDKVILGKKYDLRRFLDEEKTMEVLKDFEDFCKTNKIEIAMDRKEEQNDDQEPTPK